MKICNKCEKPKAIEEYGFRAGVQNLQCKRCCLMAKVAAKKLKEKKLQSLQPPKAVSYWPWVYNGKVHDTTSTQTQA